MSRRAIPLYLDGYEKGLFCMIPVRVEGREWDDERTRRMAMVDVRVLTELALVWRSFPSRKFPPRASAAPPIWPHPVEHEIRIS